MAYVATAALPVYAPRQLITPGYQGTLGFAFATALGAKVACPDKPVVALCGDGGFLFTANELATAVQHGIRTVTSCSTMVVTEMCGACSKICTEAESSRPISKIPISCASPRVSARGAPRRGAAGSFRGPTLGVRSTGARDHRSAGRANAEPLGPSQSGKRPPRSGGLARVVSWFPPRIADLAFARGARRQRSAPAYMVMAPPVRGALQRWAGKEAAGGVRRY